MKTSDPNRIRAFIAAPAGESLEAIRDELRKRNVEAFTAYDLPPSSASVATHVEDAIKTSDLMIAVVPKEASPNIFFELGIAHTLKKPVLVLVSPKYGLLPSDIAGYLYLRIDPDNRLALSTALDQLLNQLNKPTRRSRKEKPKHISLGNDAIRFLSELSEKELTGRDLEKLVAEILRSAGADAVIESQHPDMGADIAFWADSLEPIAGNPILVQVKKSIRSRRELKEAIEQTENYRKQSGAKLALLIANTILPALSSLPIVSGVLPIVLSSLIDKLRTKTLSETIRELCNESVHAGGK